MERSLDSPRTVRRTLPGTVPRIIRWMVTWKIHGKSAYNRNHTVTQTVNKPKTYMLPQKNPASNMGAGFPYFCFRVIMACRRSEAGSLLIPLSPLRSSIRCLAASAPPLIFSPNSAFAASSIGTYPAPAGGVWGTVSLLLAFCIFFTSSSASALEMPPGLRGMTGNGFRAGSWCLLPPTP